MISPSHDVSIAPPQPWEDPDTTIALNRLIVEASAPQPPTGFEVQASFREMVLQLLGGYRCDELESKDELIRLIQAAIHAYQCNGQSLSVDELIRQIERN